MLLFLTAASLGAASPAPAVRASPVRQARAMVTIVRAVRVGAALTAPEDSVKRVSEVRERDGTRQSVPLIEFY